MEFTGIMLLTLGYTGLATLGVAVSYEVTKRHLELGEIVLFFVVYSLSLGHFLLYLTR